MRLSTPIYRLPLTGDPIEDTLLPYVILYSTEIVGLPPVPRLGSFEPSSDTPYTLTSEPSSNGPDITLIPRFSLLVESELHLLLLHADYASPVWGQHTAQLSELLRSRSSPNGHHSLPDLVAPIFHDFAEWMKDYLEGEANYESLPSLRETYKTALASAGERGALRVMDASSLSNMV